MYNIDRYIRGSMMEKIKEKQRAIALRKKGLSYNEILKRVPVAKSTLSLWLRNIGLAKRQKQRLTKKRRIAQIKAQQTCRNNRIKATEEIKLLARKEIKNISKRELWLIGVALYWAEGAKQKGTHISERVRLGNSDPNLILIFLQWLKEVCSVTDEEILVRLYIHRTGDEKRALRYWSRVIGIPIRKFQKTTFKRHNIKTNRKVDNSKYFGLLDICVKRSTKFNRKITGWIEGISQNY